MSAADLLPSSAGTFTKALADAFIDDLPVPIETILDPDQTPVEWLPWLAAHESVDLWFDDWSESRKRAMIKDAPELAPIKGTHEAAVRFLAYVDAEVVDTVAYPARFVFGRSAAGITPINHPPFKARYLVKVALQRPVNAFELSRSGVGLAGLRSVDREPVRRAKLALKVSKANATQYLISVAWRRGLAVKDSIRIGDGRKVGGWTDRNRL